MKPFEGIEVLVWPMQPTELQGLLHTIARLGFQLRSVQSCAEFRCAIERGSAALAIAQISHTYQEPLQFLAEVGPSVQLPPTLIVSASLDVDMYLEAMQRGAYDCMGTDPDEKELVRIAAAALKARHGCLTNSGGPGR